MACAARDRAHGRPTRASARTVALPGNELAEQPGRKRAQRHQPIAEGPQALEPPDLLDELVETAAQLLELAAELAHARAEALRRRPDARLGPLLDARRPAAVLLAERV